MNKWEIIEIINKIKKDYAELFSLKDNSNETDEEAENKMLTIIESINSNQKLIETEFYENFHNYEIDFILETYHKFGDNIMVAYNPDFGYFVYDYSFVFDLDNLKTADGKNLINFYDENNIQMDWVYDEYKKMYAFLEPKEISWKPTIKEAVYEWVKFVYENNISNLVLNDENNNENYDR